ncbi:hypothetical protein PG994_002891 [Apiospora phragmitis]|uniref:Uncharacterized protein n=1 Tax=Apiospora phragmitis TaxID=2905665 RepID=A0ABR1WA94_9PEZI
MEYLEGGSIGRHVHGQRGGPWTFEDFGAQIRAGVERDTQWYADNPGITDGTVDDESIVTVMRERFFNADATREVEQLIAPSDSPESREGPVGSTMAPDDDVVIVANPVLLYRYRIYLLLAVARDKQRRRSPNRMNHGQRGDSSNAHHTATIVDNFHG